MPVDHLSRDKDKLYQRTQYNKGGIGRLCWDYRDRIILKNIRKNADIILDLGCGEGITLEKLRRAFPGKNIRGIDINKENIDICRSFNLPAEEGNIFSLNIPSGSINCCILSEVIEHLEDYDTALRQIKRVLKEGGQLLIIFPNDFIFKFYRIAALKFKEAFYDPGHLRRFTPGVMASCLKRLGFKIIRIENIPFYFWNISPHCLIVAENY